MKGSEIPDDKSMFYKRKSEGVNWGDFLLKQWKDSLQPCEISESELDKVKNKVYTFENCKADNPIDVTDIVVEMESVSNIESYIIFKQPKSDEASEVVQLLNTFGQFCTLNGIKLTDSNKVGQAVIDFLKSDIYEIFKNR